MSSELLTSSSWPRRAAVSLYTPAIDSLGRAMRGVEIDELNTRRSNINLWGRRGK